MPPVTDTTCADGGCDLDGNADMCDIFDICQTTVNGDVSLSNVEPSDIIRFRVKDADGEDICE